MFLTDESWRGATVFNLVRSQLSAFSGTAVEQSTISGHNAYLKPNAVGTGQTDDGFGGSVSVSGDTVGSHEGSFGFTIGQRRGLHLQRPARGGEPRYVLDAPRMGPRPAVWGYRRAH